MKMIIVQSPLKRDYIKQLLTQQSYGDITYRFVEEKSMKLYFEVEGSDNETAAKMAKKIIKESEVGAALYFNVSHE